VVLVEQYFYPEGWGGAEIPRAVAEALRQAGLAVAVLCGAEQYVSVAPEAAGPDPRRIGIDILRVPRILPGSHRKGRAVRTVWFCLVALVRLLTRRGVGLLLSQTNPPLVVPVVALVAAVRRVPLVIIAQDLYPEAIVAAGLLRSGSMVERVLRSIFSWAYRRARKVVVLGPSMKQRVLAKGVEAARIEIISNWATGRLQTDSDPRSNPLRSRWNLQGRFVALYSGNLGTGHEFDTLLEGVSLAIRTVPRLTLVIIGDGARLPEVRASAARLNLDAHIQFRDFVSSDDLSNAIGIGDLAVVTLRKGFEGLIVPSKLFGYLARGVPILYIGPEGDVSHYVRDGECGAVCPPGAIETLSNILREAASDPTVLARWGANGSAMYDERFRREIALRSYVDLVRGLVPSLPDA
jgi:colanic acid biosynthesis glycosyl transferase WcaI